jgi:acyl-CoA thioester hydrolase
MDERAIPWCNPCMPHEHPVRIYYEDTDHSGIVYHANYLKYFERAREHVLDPDELVRMFDEDGVGFVVYKVEMHFKAAAVHGDELVIRSVVESGSRYRVVFDQSVWRESTLLVQATIQLACVDPKGKLVPVPDSVMTRIQAQTPT